MDSTPLTLASLWAEMTRPEFALRCGISGALAATIYIFFAGLIHRAFPRTVRRDIFELSWNSDIVLGLYSVIFGSPVLQVFGVLHEKWGWSQLYTDIGSQSWDGCGGWLWLAVSMPIYLLLWDFTFYVGHLVLHMEPVYSFSHSRHHAFRPPVAWSGIAIDTIETFLSGLLPYLVPLFVAPFHLYSVYALNIALVGWATLLHSSCPWTWRGPFKWLMLTPQLHNRHHEHGIRNANFSAIFTVFDRLFGTLDTTRPVWMEEEARVRGEAKGKADAARSDSPSGVHDPTNTSKLD